ncbi:MAG: hypothetical protein ACYC2O_03770 [Microthrixaceae bacterium]
MSGPASNPAATAALWLGIGTLVCGGVLSPFALGFGLKGYKVANQLGGEGRGKALFGAIVGGVVLAAIVVLMLSAVLLSASSTSTGG